MRSFLLFLFLAAASLSPAAPPPDTGRVLLFSLDGLGYQIWTEDPVARELTALQETARAGVTARGVVPHFPSTTANSHAALWTGAYGDVNGVSANSNPVAPRAEHTFLERTIGFRAESLRAEPIWAAAARQGVRTVAYQATQAYPFLPVNTAPGAPVPPVVINGYQTRLVAPHLVLRRADVKPEDCSVWRPAVPASGCFTWAAGPHTLHGAVVDGAMLIAAGTTAERVRVLHQPTETETPHKRKLARHFSPGLFVAPDLVAHFRLFELSRDGKDFLLYQTPLHELGYYTGDGEASATLRAMLHDTGAFVGNGPSRALDQGQLGKTVHQGGDGAAELRYLEAVEFVLRQNVAQTEWLWRKHSPRLFVGYLNYPDEIDHGMLGLAHKSTPNVPPAVRGRYQEFRRRAYTIINRAVQSFARLAGPRDHVLFVSDHGMAPVWKQVNINGVLKRAGLGDHAVHVYNYVLLNTADWKSGMIPISERDDYANRVENALRDVKDPETGQPVINGFFRPLENGSEFGIGGPTGGDLYFDFAPGYSFTNTPGAPIVSPVSVPRANHGFLPIRTDMLAICIGRGPRLLHGDWPTLRAIDIAPLIANLLGIRPPGQSQGRSPLTLGLLK